MGNLERFEKNLKKQEENEEIEKEDEETDKKEVIQEDNETIKRIVSRLCFIRSDLKEIERLDIKTKEIRQVLQGIKSRTELLLNLFFPEKNGK